jgi:hypothetical protein
VSSKRGVFVWSSLLLTHRKARSIEKQTTTSMVSSQSLSNNKHDRREAQQPKQRRNNNNKSLPYDDLLEYETGQKHWPRRWPTQTTIDRATTRRKRKNERRTSIAPRRSQNTKKVPVTRWTWRISVSCGVTATYIAFWSKSRWSLESMNLDSIELPIRCLFWSFQKAWKGTWSLTQMDDHSLYSLSSLYRTSRTKRGAKERRRNTMTTTTTEGEAIHVVSIHDIAHPAKHDRTFVTIWTRVFLSLDVALSFVFFFFFSLSHCMCLLVCVFCLSRLSLSFPLYRTGSLCVALFISLSSAVVNISSWSEIRSFSFTCAVILLENGCIDSRNVEINKHARHSRCYFLIHFSIIIYLYIDFLFNILNKTICFNST